MPYYLFKKCGEFSYRYYGGIACAPAVKERYAFFSSIWSDDPQYPNGGWAGARGAIISHETGFPMKIGLLELQMGVETPMPPKMITTAASDGAPPRRIKTVEKIYLPIFMDGV